MSSVFLSVALVAVCDYNQDVCLYIWEIYLHDQFTDMTMNLMKTQYASLQLFYPRSWQGLRCPCKSLSNQAGIQKYVGNVGNVGAWLDASQYTFLSLPE